MKQLIVAALLFLPVACDRPAVAVQSEVGKAGMFCVTAKDCAHGLGCLDRHCCRNEECASTCQSLIEKDPELSQNTLSGHPGLADYVRRRCYQRCCQGDAAADLKDALRAPTGDFPEHRTEIIVP